MRHFYHAYSSRLGNVGGILAKKKGIWNIKFIKLTDDPLRCSLTLMLSLNPHIPMGTSQGVSWAKPTETKSHLLAIFFRGSRVPPAERGLAFREWEGKRDELIRGLSGQTGRTYLILWVTGSLWEAMVPADTAGCQAHTPSVRTEGGARWKHPRRQCWGPLRRLVFS